MMLGWLNVLSTLTSIGMRPCFVSETQDDERNLSFSMNLTATYEDTFLISVSGVVSITCVPVSNISAEHTKPYAPSPSISWTTYFRVNAGISTSSNDSRLLYPHTLRISETTFRSHAYRGIMVDIVQCSHDHSIFQRYFAWLL